MSDQIPATSPDAIRSRPRKRFLGEMLRDRGVITPEQPEEVPRPAEEREGSRLGRLLVDLGYATESQICEVIAEQLHIPAADLAAVDVPNEVLNLVGRPRPLSPAARSPLSPATAPIAPSHSLQS